MKVLLVDTAFSAIPIYDYLTSTGHEVWVMGNRQSDILAKRAGDRWVEQDYSRVSEVKSWVSRHGIDAVVPGCTDVSIETCLQLGLNPDLLDSPDTYAKLGNKMEFRNICRALNLPAPLTVLPESFPRQGQFICKPVDSFSGRGITIFDGQDTALLNKALLTAQEVSPSKSALIEELCDGDLYSCSAFVENGDLIETFYVLEGSSANRFAVDTSYLTDDLPLECTELLNDALRKVCLHLGLKDGLLHTQFIYGGGQPYIVEMSRRCPGDLYALLIEFSTGYPYAAKYASYLVRDKIEARQIERNFVLRHTVSGTKAGVYSGLRFRRPVSTRAFFPINSMGAELLPKQGTRAGILFCEAKNYTSVRSAYDAFLSREAYDVD